MKITYFLLLTIIYHGAVCCSEIPKVTMSRYLLGAIGNAGQYIYCDPISGVRTQEDINNLIDDVLKQNGSTVKELAMQNNFEHCFAILSSSKNSIEITVFPEKQRWEKLPLFVLYGNRAYTKLYNSEDFDTSNDVTPKLIK